MFSRPERFGDADEAGPETWGPQKPDQPVPEKLSDVEEAAANAVAGEIREFVRRDVAFIRRRRSEVEPVSEPVADNLNALIRRVSGASVDEIDRVILELQGMRDMLRNEGERVSREIAGYASLSHSAMTSIKVIGDSLSQWEIAPGKSDQRSAS